MDPDLCKDLDYVISKEVMLEQIVRRSSSATVILSHLYSEDSFKEPEEHFTKDLVGLVALLGTVSDDRISRSAIILAILSFTGNVFELYSEFIICRILAGYLGEDQMLAVVCKTYEAASAMEKYKEDGEVDSNLALHGKAAALGKPICGRFLVICLEDIRCAVFPTKLYPH